MNESLLGLSTIDCARRVVAKNTQVSHVIFRAYRYIPNQPSSDDESRFLVKRREFLNGFDPEDLLVNLGSDFNVALDSKVGLRDGGIRQLLMVDLAPSKSADNLAKVVGRLREIIKPYFGGGFLLETGRSYQFLGFEKVDLDGWLSFLGRCLITSIVTKTPEDQPNIHEVIADYRYIGHSLLRRSTGLRVTTRGTKTFQPRSVAII